MGYGPVLIAIVATPLVWVTVLHLAIGSAVLGLIEGLVLVWLLGARWQRAVWTMVAANYFSMLLGLLLLSRLGDWLSVDLYNLSWAMWVVYAAAYVLTVVAELPFIYFLVAPGATRFRQAVRGSLVAQSVAAVILALAYAPVTTAPTRDGWKIVRPDELPLPQGIELYYLGVDDAGIYRLDPGVSRPQKIGEFTSIVPDEGLGFVKVEGEMGVKELRSAGRTLQPTIRKVSAATPARPPLYPEESWDGFLWRGRISSLVKPGAPLPEFSVFIGRGELNGTDSQGRSSWRLAAGLPQFRWVVRDAIQLPGGEIVIQLGKNQVCLADPRQMKLTLLARGQGFVPALVGWEPATGPATQQVVNQPAARELRSPPARTLLQGDMR